MLEQDAVGIAGVRLVSLDQHVDERGWFVETYRREWLADRPAMVQGNVSYSAQHVLRGMHFHRSQADYWCVITGRAFIALFDLRRESPTEGAKTELQITAEEDRRGVYIPPGVAHGFCAETPMVLQYLVDAYYTGEDEFGIAWDDHEMDIGWPRPDPVLSERDRRNPPLAHARGAAPDYTG
jgi:dTDP-4-dehydrorhamnose 3,5-epimerase